MTPPSASSPTPPPAIPLIQRVVAILWPSFITAGIATIVFATVFDPKTLFMEYDFSRMAIYSVSFFLFWLMGVINAMSTCFFLMPCSIFNKCKTRQDAAAPE